MYRSDQEKGTTGAHHDLSLAAADSLALSSEGPEGEIFVEHTLPSDEIVEKKTAIKRKIRRNLMMCFSACLLVGIVLLAVMLTRPKRDPEIAGTADTGDTVSSIDSAEGSVDQTVAPIPGIYYLLESKVHRPANLLDMDTPEGKAFSVLVDETKAKEPASSRSVDGIDLQRYALLVLYFGSDGGAWTNKSGWSTVSEICEDWHGVVCQDALVTGIDLDRNNLHGKIPEDFCLVDSLKHLKLGGNKLELPSCLATLSNLEKLDLRRNNHTGGLPSDLYSMTSLAHLELSSNQFEGPIDALFPQHTRHVTIFPKLETISLANNKLTGEIPDGIFRHMPKLDRLNLEGNPGLTGSLNELCKGDGISQIDADCETISCKCCTSGDNCPSSFIPL